VQDAHGRTAEDETSSGSGAHRICRHRGRQPDNAARLPPGPRHARADQSVGFSMINIDAWEPFALHEQFFVFKLNFYKLPIRQSE
jgi:hypothetical protein